jgi:hypothetical protein
MANQNPEISQKPVKKTLLWISLAMLSVVLLFSFTWLRQKTSLNTLEFQHIFDRIPDCPAPCWQGLTPGKSAREDYQLFVEEVLAQEFILSYEETYDEGKVLYSWKDKATGLPVSFAFDNNTLTEIGFNPHATSLDTFFEQWGFPSHYSAAYREDMSAYIAITLFYEDVGIVIIMPGINAYKAASCVIELPLDRRPRFLSFVEPGSGKQMYIETVGNELFARGMVVQEWTGVDEIRLNPCR